MSVTASSSGRFSHDSFGLNGGRGRTVAHRKGHNIYEIFRNPLLLESRRRSSIDHRESFVGIDLLGDIAFASSNRPEAVGTFAGSRSIDSLNHRRESRTPVAQDLICALDRGVRVGPGHKCSRLSDYGGWYRGKGRPYRDACT